MEQEQEEFKETIESLKGTVDGFAANDNMEKYLEYAVDVDSINKRMQECQEKARIYN